MTLTEQLVAANNAVDTNWTSALRMSALGGVLLLTPQFTGIVEDPRTLIGITSGAAEDTYRTTEIGTDAELRELLSQFARVYEYLADTIDLDDEAHELLYSNLWQLYE
jgi:hypothetical protein